MWRIEGSSPVLTIIQLIGGTITAWVVMFGPAIWATAAFRPEIDPSTVRTLNDLGFILFNITYAATSVQAVAAGLVGLADKSARPVTGVSHILAARRANVEDTDRGPMTTMGAVVTAVGLVLLIWPGTGVVAISWIIAPAALLFAALLIFLALHLKWLKKRVDNLTSLRSTK
jgi:hypothetical protein